MPLAGLDGPLDSGGGRGQRGRAGGGQRRLGSGRVLLPGTGPAEIDARLRLLIGRRGNLQDQEGVGKISLGELVIDEGTYTARLRGVRSTSPTKSSSC